MAIAPSMTCWPPLRRVLYGISCRNRRGGRRGDSRGDRPVGVDGVPMAFIQASATAKLRELQERDLSGEDVVALRAGRQDRFAESTMVVALGITMTGDKRFLGFVETVHRERDRC